MGDRTLLHLRYSRDLVVRIGTVRRTTEEDDAMKYYNIPYHNKVSDDDLRSMMCSLMLF